MKSPSSNGGNDWSITSLARSAFAEVPVEFFDVEEQNETMILTPAADMGELDHERLDMAMKHVLDRLNQSSVKCIVLDFHKTDYFGSTALGFFVRIWKTTCTRKGRMAFCNLS